MPTTDSDYVSVLLKPLRLCANYRPAFGQAGAAGTTLEGFKIMYGTDPLYHWVGLDSDLMYAAHKAAGGMTSVYRQLGIGCERLFRFIASRELGLTPEQLAWGYDVKGSKGTISHLELDGRIDVDHIQNTAKRERVAEWVGKSAESIGITRAKRKQLSGAVFEIRQGYKSADAKRQNADLRSAVRAGHENYLFTLAVMSTQLNHAVQRRYQNAQVQVLVGSLNGNPVEDTFAFFDQVLEYSLRGFFERNSAVIRAEVEGILTQLLSPA